MADAAAPDNKDVYDEIQASDEFRVLQRSYRRFAIPWTITFFLWYMLYVVCCNWATDFMSTKVIGNINVALIFGVLQFLSTFGIAYLYARHANQKLDPIAGRLEAKYDKAVGR